MPFVIVYLQDIGLNGLQISFLAGLLPIILIVGAPLLTSLADTRKQHRRVMSFAIVISVLVTGIFPLFKSFGLILVLTVSFALVAGSIISFGDSATMTRLGAEKDLYGRVRLGGTIGWGVFAPIASLVINQYGSRWAFWGYAAILAITIPICQKFTFSQRSAPETVTGNLRIMLRDPKWIFFLILAFLGGLALSVTSNYLFPYMEDLSISRSTWGFALTIATLSELPVLFFSNYLIARFRAHGLLVVGLIITGLRMILYGVLDTQSGILIFQLLNGFTTPLVMVAAVSYANDIAPEGMKTTAQGLVGAAVSGFGAAVGGVIGGLLLSSLGGQVMFLFTGAAILAVVGLVWMLERSRQSRLAKVKTTGL